MGTDWAGVAILVTAVFSGCSTFLTAVVGAIILVRQNRNHQAISKVTDEVVEVKANVATIEKSTNSMKDQLIQQVAKAAFVEGVGSVIEKQIVAKKE